MVLPKPLESEIEKRIGAKVRSSSPVSGGCINNGARISTGENRFFIKWNDEEKFPGMFASEANGLRLLRSVNAIRIPEVVAVGTSGSYQYLLLEHIDTGRAKTNTWEEFGKQLARLHSNSSDKFGLDHSNYIGSLRQSNEPARSWVNFFRHERLQKQIDLAMSKKIVEAAIQNRFDKLYRMLPGILTDEPPSLLHGDLWGGNVMIDSSGNPVLIDPAVYYGHREADLAMTQLFRGFDNEYLEAYNDVFPLISGVEDRFRIYNLYPLLVHVNLFGRSYLGQLVSNLDYFVLKTG